MAKRSEQKPVDQRAKAIGNIWQAAVALLAVSISLSLVLRSAVIPLTIIVGAVLVTLYLWNVSSTDREAEDAENDALRAKIKELEERLANVEIINRFEDRLAEKRLRQTDEKPVAGEPETARAHEHD